MSFRVHLLPSGKEFTAEKNETVLEAALRSGIALNYSCNTGTCGGCGGRILSGQIRETRQHDFHLSDTQKAQGHVLLCVTAAQSDLEIEVKEAGGIEDIPLQMIPTKVEQMERVQDDTMILHLHTPRTQTLRFLAGQHLSLAIAGLPPRNKSLASCPCNAMHLQFHIRRVPGDPFSEYVFTQLKISQTVTVEGPWGNFSLDESSKRPIIFVAYETGFASIKSIIEHAIALELEQPLHLYWMAHRPGNHYLNNLCRSWLDALDNFSYTALTGDDLSGESSWEASTDPVVGLRDMQAAGAAIVADHPDLAGFDVYLTAPESSTEEIVGLLQRHGLPKGQLHLDVMKRF
ncbi:MAG: 2Fe-2S iron-sulfur cluster-binding protein [Sulfuricella sp.]